MSKKAIILVVLVPLVLIGCSKKEDEDLVAYVKQFEPLQEYNRQAQKYLTDLTDEPEMVEDLQSMYKLIDDYEAAVLNLTRPKTSRIQAIHGIYVRTFPQARRQLTKMTEPNQYSLQKTKVAYEKLKGEITGKLYPPIQALLEEFGLQDQYPVAWPE